MSTSTITPTITPTSTPKPIKPDYEIKLTVKDGYVLAPDETFDMTVGETVRYSSEEGEVKILFQQYSPFRTDDLPGTTVPGAVILTLVSGSIGGGLVPCACFITLPDGTEVGYKNPNDPLAGVHKRVTPPR